MSPDFPLPNFSIDLSGDVALVTGASSGLGLRFAQTLAAAGAAVVLGARRTDRLETVVAAIRERGGRAIAVALDVTDPASIRSAVETAQESFGLVTILINNAGIGDAQRATDVDLETIDALINTNFRAPLLLSAEVARRLIEAGSGGRIVNLSSMGAFTQPDSVTTALYSSTKAAVVRLTETLAKEWVKQRINVNAIAPGVFVSEMSTAHLDVEQLAGFYPRKRVGDPAQLDSTLLYLVSPASELVTGTCIMVDDGQFSR